MEISSAARAERRSFLQRLAAAAAALAATEDSLAPFMAQSACQDARDAPLPGRLPFEPDCDRTRPLSAGEPLPYRKHDWPGVSHAAAQPLGYQASDSVRGTLLGRPAVLQTFDFGGGARAFNRFDSGDGGQAVLLRDGAAASPLTEDGGGGVQWFQSPDCRAAAGPAPGWLFAAQPLSEAWQERVVRLNKSRGPDQCPTVFSPSLTRWRTARIDLPWREAATGAVSAAPAEVLVSEHFGGASVGTADHLERFWFARGLGLVRWERWENPARSRLPDRDRRARIIAESRRCPPVAFGEPPAEGWQLVDCRTWTNMVRAAPGAPLSALAWPAPELR
ncbi:MAG: twin-arginine translocation signal domain-containing protein [Acetobacteraceae bacterium]|nr:twin-arginine translocation signal domain-containing protein [Acetobacteraceae bacterium]